MKKILLSVFATFTLFAQAQTTVDFDNSFATNGVHKKITNKLLDGFSDVAIASDSKIYGLGIISETGQNGQMFVARFNINGTLDNSFGTNGLTNYYSTNNYYTFGQEIAIQTDGKILVAGTTDDTLGGSTYKSMFIMRLNTNGSYDNTFGTNGIATIPHTSFNNYEYLSDMFLQSDGKILCVRESSDYSNSAVYRLNINGTVDNTFATNGSFKPTGLVGEHLVTVAQGPDGNIVAAGYRSLSGTGGNFQHIIAYKLNANGSLSSSFGNNGKLADSISGSVTYAKDVMILNDNKILIGGGKYIQGNPESYSYILKLNTNGTRDLTFNSIGYNQFNYNNKDYGFNDFKIDAAGKIVALSINETDGELCLYRLNSNGTNDNTFNQNTHFKYDNTYFYNSEANSGLALQNDGKYIVANMNFISDSLVESLMIRFGEKFPASIASINSNKISIYPNPVKEILFIDLDKEVNYTIVDVLGKTVQSGQTQHQINVANLSKGVYFIQIENESLSFTKE